MAPILLPLPVMSEPSLHGTVHIDYSSPPQLFVCFLGISNNYVSLQPDIIVFQSQLCHELRYMILDKVLNLAQSVSSSVEKREY